MKFLISILFILIFTHVSNALACEAGFKQVKSGKMRYCISEDGSIIKSRKTGKVIDVNDKNNWRANQAQAFFKEKYAVAKPSSGPSTRGSVKKASTVDVPGGDPSANKEPFKLRGNPVAVLPEVVVEQPKPAEIPPPPGRKPYPTVDVKPKEKTKLTTSQKIEQIIKRCDDKKNNFEKRTDEPKVEGNINTDFCDKFRNLSLNKSRDFCSQFARSRSKIKDQGKVKEIQSVCTLPPNKKKEVLDQKIDDYIDAISEKGKSENIYNERIRGYCQAHETYENYCRDGLKHFCGLKIDRSICEVSEVPALEAPAQATESGQ